MTKQYPNYVTPSIASNIFCVTTQTLRRWAKEGKISFIKTPGGQYRYNVEGVIGALQAPDAPKTPKRHPARPAPVQVPASAPVAPVATAPAPKVAKPAAANPAPAPKLDHAALMHKIESLATASAV